MPAAGGITIVNNNATVQSQTPEMGKTPVSGVVVCSPDADREE